jgi:cell wall-associated NlpC family hydrolase
LKNMSTRRKSFIAVLTSTALVLGAALGGPAFANPNYPSAAEVAAAKANVTSKQNMITRIENLIADLEDEVEVLNREASIKSEIYLVAKEEVDVVTRKVEVLRGQAEQALAEADQAAEQLGQIASQMFRGGAGGTSLNLFLNSNVADDLLYQLGAQEKLAQQTEVIYQKSLERQRLAKAITDELAAAEEELAAIAAIAEAAFAEAQAAADAVAAKIEANREQNEIFFSQLASLRQTASELERLRAEGLAWERRQAAGRGIPQAPELYTVGAPDAAKVAQVIAFAKAQLGKGYILGAAGPNYWDCSGLTMKAYASVGINIGWHSVSNQFITAMDKRQLVPLSQLQPGDLIFWSRSRDHLNRNYGSKYHIGIYLGNDQFIEAPNPSSVVRIRNLSGRTGELVPYGARPTA